MELLTISFDLCTLQKNIAVTGRTLGARSVWDFWDGNCENRWSINGTRKVWELLRWALCTTFQHCDLGKAFLMSPDRNWKYLGCHGEVRWANTVKHLVQDLAHHWQSISILETYRILDYRRKLTFNPNTSALNYLWASSFSIKCGCHGTSCDTYCQSSHSLNSTNHNPPKICYNIQMTSLTTSGQDCSIYSFPFLYGAGFWGGSHTG